MSPGNVKNETLKALRQTRKEMMTAAWSDAIQQRPPEERREAAIKLLDTNNAIHALQNAVLAEIRDKLIANETELLQGIADLRKALENLTQVKKIINTLGKVLEGVAKVVDFIATHV